MRLKRLCFAILSASVFFGACSGEKGTPEAVVRSFLRATLYGDTEKIVGLLAPESVQELEALAHRATVQAGGNRTYKAADMLAPRMDPPRYPWRQIQKVEVVGSQAKVVISTAVSGSGAGAHQQTLNLRKTEQGWRVLLGPALPAK